ncbi:MAG: transglutaminase-like domain-containing protein [Vicinamibacterales bacterium]
MDTRDQPRIELEAIPTGYAGTLRTVAHVIELIRAGAKDFRVRQTAIAILRRRGVRPKDYLGEIKALFEWVQQHIRYTRDPFRVEVLHSPRRMLQLRAGDCDDMAIVLGAMLEAVGHCVRLVLTGNDPLAPDRFTHIYIEALCRGRWVSLDATMPYPMGWAPRAPVRRVIAITNQPAARVAASVAPRPQRAAEAREGEEKALAEVDEGVGLYQTFNRFPPSALTTVRHPRAIPPVVVELGRLVGLIYRSDKWQPGRPRTFIHFMEHPPRLTCSPAGTQLYVIGGRYRVTDRGIEG